jgi:predicted cobalt transporter CbtA
MNQRPLSITIISCIFIAAAALGLAHHLVEFKLQHPFQYDVVWAGLVGLTAIVCGVFMFRGSNWARWLSLVWIAGHVVLGAFHSMHQLLAHGLLFAVFAYFLLRPQAAEYFHAKGSRDAKAINR